MSTATVSAPAVEIAEKADVRAIRVAAAPGATVADLLKAVWSTRGFLRVNFGAAADFGGLGVIKSDLTGVLKALPPADPAPYLLTPVDGGAVLVPVEAPAAE